MPVKISIATPKEFLLIKSIAYKTWPIAYKEIVEPNKMEYMLQMMYNEEALEKQVQVQGHVFLLGQLGEEYLGYASYELNYEESHSTKLHKIYILPEAQGKGVGQALLNEVKSVAAQAQQKSILLTVHRENPATNFYKHYGFKIVKEVNSPIGNGFFMNDYLMEFSLTPVI